MIVAALALAALQTNTFELLPRLSGFDWATPEAISTDGETVIGFAYREEGGRAVRWVGGKIELLATGEGTQLTAPRAVSRDGKTVGGFSRDSEGFEQATLWRDDKVEQLHRGVVHALSDDGKTLAGYRPGPRGFRGFWTRGEETLGVLHPDGQEHGVVPEAMSADGETIVGHAEIEGGTGRAAFRWRRATGKSEKLVGVVGSEFTYATDVNADGSIVLGYSSHPEAGKRLIFLWNAEGKAEEILADEVKAGWTLMTSGGGAHLDPTGQTVLVDGRTDDRVHIAYLWRRGHKPVSVASLLPNAPKIGEVSDLTTLPDGRIVLVGETEDQQGFRAVVKL